MDLSALNILKLPPPPPAASPSSLLAPDRAPEGGVSAGRLQGFLGEASLVLEVDWYWDLTAGSNLASLSGDPEEKAWDWDWD